ncbi:MAG: acyltransferase [Aeromicrobium erythreum]
MSPEWVEWWHKRRWHGRGQRPLARLALTRELARRRAYARGRLLGEPLEMLRDGRLVLGEQVMLEPDVWITGSGHVSIGAGSILNVGVMVAALDRVSIGSGCMLANGCVVTDSDHVISDPDRPATWQGFTSRGPTTIGDDTWLGAHVVVTSGVSIGNRCIIGAGAVVTHDVPDWSVAVGVPARVVRSLRAEPGGGPGSGPESGPGHIHP